MRRPAIVALWRAARAVLVSLSIGLAIPATGYATVYPVRGFLPDLKFTLRGADNTEVTQKAFLGKVVLLYFGYASCPDICPTTMAQLALLTESLGQQADQVRILFVSVDPHRDTPDILQRYVDQFDRHAIGLTGSESRIADLARRYRVSYQVDAPAKGAPAGSYDVAHSRAIYAFDAQGRAAWMASDSASQKALRAALEPLLH